MVSTLSPARAATVTGSMPFEIRRETKEWRRSWQEIGCSPSGLSFALSPALRISSVQAVTAATAKKLERAGSFESAKTARRMVERPS